MNLKRPGRSGRILTCTLLAAACFAATGATQMNFTPMAGGMTGDGGQAKGANMHGVRDVVIDNAGNMYVAQYAANRIRKIAPNGTITTIAGGNGFGFAGDGGPAASALIDRPTSLTVDGAGNIYFVDWGNRRVRKISAAGVITTVAGNGTSAFAGDGGPALQASFSDPQGIAVDNNGNLYVADSGSYRVRKVSAAGVISTVAGNGSSMGPVQGAPNNVPATSVGVGQPYGVDVDANGNVYFVTLAGNFVFRVATDGVLTQAVSISGAAMFDVEVDATGALFIGGDCSLYKVPSGGAPVRYGGTGCGNSPEGTSATTAMHWAVEGIAVDASGNIYGAEPESMRVFKVAASNLQTTTFAGGKPQIPNGTPGANSALTTITAIAVDENNSAVLADMNAYHVRTLTNGAVSTIGGTGEPWSDCGICDTALQTGFGGLAGVATGPGGVVFASDRSLGSVLRIAPNGALTAYPMYSPRGIASDDVGNVYVADYSDSAIQKIDPSGIVTKFAGSDPWYEGEFEGVPAANASVPNPREVAVDAMRRVYFTDGLGAIRRVDTDGIVRHVAGFYDPQGGTPTGDTTLALNHKFGVISGLAAHPSGLYVAEGRELKRVTPAGRVETLGPWSDWAYDVAVRNSFLWVSTLSGRVYRAPVPRITPNDLNGDRKSDIVWRSTTGGNLVWLGANSATTQAIASQSTQFKLSGQGDFDGDGANDLFWRNTSTGTNVVWRNGNSATQMIPTAVSDQGWQVVGVGDFNGDGKSDLVWRHRVNGRNQVWYSANSSTQIALTSVTDMNWEVAGVGDFDGDGKSDLLWHHKGNGRNEIWSAGNSSQRKPIVAVSNTAWKIVGVGDFNGDGVSDIVWRNVSNGANTIWKAGDNTTQITIAGVSNLAWTIAATGDYDNDGIFDLLWRNKSTGANTLWLNARNTTQRAVGTGGLLWSIQPYEAQP